MDKTGATSPSQPASGFSSNGAKGSSARPLRSKDAFERQLDLFQVAFATASNGHWKSKIDITRYKENQRDPHTTKFRSFR